MNDAVIAEKYRIITELGRGGMGRVYKVRHIELDAIFALKILHDDWAARNQALARFLDEARIMAKLQHNNIVRVHDIDRDDARYYIVMEYIDGVTLADLIAERRALAVEHVLSITAQIGQALAYAHAQTPAVVHRDIKPSNIMIENHTDRVLVTDFGIAKRLDPERTHQTRSGFMVGTPLYASPEQLRSDRTLDGRSDIFSLGLVVYEMLTGEKFFEGLTTEEVIGQKLYDPRAFDLRLEDRISPDLSALIARAIAKDRDQRFASAQEMLDAMQRISGQEPVPRKPMRPKPMLWPWFAGPLIVSLGIALWWLLPSSDDDGRQPDASTAVRQIVEPDSGDNRPPLLIGLTPQNDHIQLAVGQTMRFAVDAVDIEEDPHLSYFWYLNGQEVSREPEWRLQTTQAEVYQVRVTVADTLGAESTHQWRVTVTHN